MGHGAQLIVSVEGQPDRTLDLTDLLTIGRSTGNQLVLPDQNASRKHAEIRATGPGRFRIFDLGSANGTWVNSRRLTVPKDLEDGDQVIIGNITMRFVGPESAGQDEENDESLGTGMFATAVAMRNETVVVLVCDVRGYTRMSEHLPAQEFARIISDWFKQATETIERNRGTIDKFIGDAVMCYWVCRQDSTPADESNAALTTAQELMELADEFSIRVANQFKGWEFRIGVGINVGDAIFGNMGAAGNASFTIVGDSVNVAFRLESLCKEKQAPVLVSGAVAALAHPRFSFYDLGEAEVKGRKEPVPIRALRLEAKTRIG